jgi:hypothetical protein
MEPIIPGDPTPVAGDSRAGPAAYSESVRLGDTYTRQCGNRTRTASSHSPMPASPV